MALKREDKVRLEGLEKTFEMLISNDMEFAQIMTMMQPQFDEFERISNLGLNVKKTVVIPLWYEGKDEIESWKYHKGAKSEERIVKATGFKFDYKEGA